jgi:hypothetical protein
MMHKRSWYALEYRNKYVNKLKVKVSKQQNTVKVKTPKAIKKKRMKGKN